MFGSMSFTVLTNFLNNRIFNHLPKDPTSGRSTGLSSDLGVKRFSRARRPRPQVP